MITWEHRPLGHLFLLALLFGVAFLLWRIARGRRKLISIPARVGAVVLWLGLAVVLLFFGAMQIISGSTTESSKAIYSPDRKHAVVIRNWAAGGWGGAMYADLYSLGGLREEGIAWGDEEISHGEDVRWTSNGEVIIRYDPSYDNKAQCEGTKSVRVLCMPAH